jgi:hypothetical protein
MKIRMNYHKTAALLPALLLALAGCSRYSPGTKMSGDLVPFVMKCATDLGAHPLTNNLPAMQAQWTFKSIPLKIGPTEHVQDLIAIQGNHLDEVQAFLKRAFGEINPALGSRPLSPVKGADSLQAIYSPKQIGATLSCSTLTIRPLGMTTTTTMIQIIGSPAR